MSGDMLTEDEWMVFVRPDLPCKRAKGRFRIVPAATAPVLAKAPIRAEVPQVGNMLPEAHESKITCRDNDLSPNRHSLHDINPKP